jgi:Ca2+-binding EF-hand superfamily protein
MKYQIVLLASAALVATAVVAGDGEKKTKGASSTFEMLDKDSDGKLSREEISGSESLTANFTMLDSDSDGYVSKGEFKRNTRAKPDRSGY